MGLAQRERRPSRCAKIGRVAGEQSESRAFRRALVGTLRAAGLLRSARVAAAMEAVPREVFVPGVPLAEVYRPSDAIVTKRVDGVSVSSASAPEVVAVMLEQLDPRPGDRVLEIGAGTGYNAALLAHLVGETGQVVTLDIDADLVEGAREHLSARATARSRSSRPTARIRLPDDSSTVSSMHHPDFVSEQRHRAGLARSARSGPRPAGPAARLARTAAQRRVRFGGRSSGQRLGARPQLPFLARLAGPGYRVRPVRCARSPRD